MFDSKGLQNSTLFSLMIKVCYIFLPLASARTRMPNAEEAYRPNAPDIPAINAQQNW